MANSEARNLPAEESFSAVAEHAPAMLWRGDEGGKCIYLNRAQREFWGVDADKIAEFSWATTLLPEDSDKVFGPFAEGMSAQKAFTCEAQYRRADGAIRILQTHGEPRFAADGRFTGMVGINTDVTEARRAEFELSESEARLRALADNIPYGMAYQIIMAPDGSNKRFSFVSNRCEALNGVAAENALKDAALLYNLIEPEFLTAFIEAESAAIERLVPFEFETRMRHTNGNVRWFRIASAPRRLASGDIAWDGVQVDIHDVKMAEERRRLILREMSHRVKNLLSTVQSIASQTGRSAASLPAFSATFQARLRALSQSHDLLLRDSTDSAGLRDVLEAELRPYADAERALTLQGDDVRLSGRAALNVALVVHELATNAAKYGAYAGAGSVDVSWTASASEAGERVTLVWRERGGPPVQTPARKGFGTVLIETLVAGDLRGRARLDYAPHGLVAELEFTNMPAADSSPD